MKEPDYKFDFFLCCSGKDYEYAEQIFNKLEDFSVFYPARDLIQSSGEMYFDVLADALANSKNLIVLITPDALKSQWVKIEYQSFFSNFYSEKDDRKIYLLKGAGFVLKEVPIFLRTFQISDHVEQITDKLLQNKSPGFTLNEKKHKTATENRTSIYHQNKNGKNNRKKLIKAAVFIFIILSSLALIVVYKTQIGDFVNSHFGSKTKNTQQVDDTKSLNEKAEVIPPEIHEINTEAHTESVSFNSEGKSESLMQEEFKEITESKVNESSGNDLSLIKDELESTYHDHSQLLSTLKDVQEINFPNGNSYKGEIKDGVLHGRGIYTYKVKSLISRNDPLQRYAEPGCHLSGEWNEGELYIGKLYDSKGALITQIIIGKN